MSSTERCDEIIRLIDQVLKGQPDRPGPKRAAVGRPVSGQGPSSTRAASLLP